MQAETAGKERRPPFTLNISDDTTKRLNTLMNFVETQTERVLSRNRSVDGLTSIIRKADLMMDQEALELQRGIDKAIAAGFGEPIVCQKGCSYCCYRVPEATIPEAINIWRFVLDSFSEEEMKGLYERVLAYVEETQPLRPDSLGQARSACPLLVDDVCSVYEHRPLTCRGLNSTDAGVCREIKERSKAPSERPSWSAKTQLGTVIRMGLRLGFFFESAEPSVVDLGHAIFEFFKNPAAVAGYLEGKDHFVASRSNFETEGFDINRIALDNGPAFQREGESQGPSGDIPLAERPTHQECMTLINQEGRFFDAMALLGGSTPTQMLLKMAVPRMAMTEAEIDQSRDDFVRAMDEFEAANFSPDDCFDALSTHYTMPLTYQGRDNRDIMARHGKLIVEGITAKALPDLTATIEGQRRPGKLRVGYISANLTASNGGRWADAWLKNHGPEIERYCFLIGARSDSISDRFRQNSDHFYWLKRTVPENARFIRSLDLDVLIYTDIGLHPRNTQYSALRLARTQCTAWGHPDTTGLSTIDYYISSELMEPADGEKFYTEKLVRLPRAGLVFESETQPFPPADRAYFGLPETGPLIVMMQASLKLVPRFDHLYAEIAERAGVPIVFLESKPSGDGKQLRKRLELAGVRTQWLPQMSNAEFLALLNLADVSIDPPLWSGGNSTLQTLSVRTPVVTLPGPFMRSRHSFAFLHLAGAPGLIASDEKDYVDLVCDFDRQKEAARELDTGPLYNDVGVVKALDEFLFSVSEA